MSEPHNSTEVPADQTTAADEVVDETKHAMRRALDAKKATQQQNTDGVASKKSIGGPHGRQGGARQFRRKSGG